METRAAVRAPRHGRHGRPGRRAGVTLAGAALAASVLAVPAVVLFWPSSPATPAARPPAAVRKVPAPAVQPAPPRAVRTADVFWQPYNGAQLPVSRLHGPRSLSKGLAAGFSHDRAGAVLAAVHLVTRVGFNAGPDVYVRTLRQQCIGEVDSAVTATDALYREEGAQPFPATTLDGYQVQQPAGPDNAFVHLRITAPNGDSSVSADFLLAVRWTAGDWRLVVPAGADFPHYPAGPVGRYRTFNTL